MRTISLLTIKHNHGVCVLLDVTLKPYKSGENTWHVAEGTVISGGSTSRLFHATSHTPYVVGEKMEWDIHGKADHIYPDVGGGFRLDVTFC